MSKYVIRDCPAFVLMRTATSGTYFDICGNAKGHIKCVDCTDCVMKQIVENLTQVAHACHCDNCDGCGYYSGCSDTECGTYQVLKSLELLDIQEVE
jgi:hypothetical protein